MESKLRDLKTKRSVKAYALGGAIESKHEAFIFPDSPKTRAALKSRLINFGLLEEEAELLLSRLVDEKLLAELGWSNESGARYHLKRLLKKLREGKFRL